jgi:hypothetical protein
MTAGYDLFRKQIKDASITFPTLKIEQRDERQILKGNLSIVDRDGKYWDDYDIEIHFSEKFPNEFPRLYETSNKIPKVADWHIYEDTLSCCVKVFPEEILKCKKGITVVEYIQEEALPYLFNQTHRRLEGYYINGEYSHGLLGIYEFYAGKLNTGSDVQKTVNLLNFIITNERPGRTHMCFCGNGNKFRHCHKDAFDTIKEIGEVIVKRNITQFIHAIQVLSYYQQT